MVSGLLQTVESLKICLLGQGDAVRRLEMGIPEGHYVA